MLAPLYDETRAIYGIERPPDGLLTLSATPEPVQKLTEDVRQAFPALNSDLLEPGDVERLEPSLVPGLWACRTDTAWAVPPAKAVKEMWERAQAAGARLAGWPEAFELDRRLAADPVWGVVAEVELEVAPRHVLEEAGIPELAEALGAGHGPWGISIGPAVARTNPV